MDLLVKLAGKMDSLVKLARKNGFNRSAVRIR
jgi:hypothetical protein